MKYLVKHFPAKDVTMYLLEKHVVQVPESWRVVDADENEYGSFTAEADALRYADILSRGDEAEADYSA